jgi:hypothetical protein
LTRKQFEVSDIVELSDRYDVSKEAAARRCIDLHDDPIAVVFSHLGVVRRAYRGKGFPRLGVGANDPLPADSIAKRAMLLVGQNSDWGEAPAHQWVEKAKGSVCEQSIGQQNGHRMTLLTYEMEEVDEEEEEEIGKAWAPPQFNRR